MKTNCSYAELFTYNSALKFDYLFFIHPVQVFYSIYISILYDILLFYIIYYGYLLCKSCVIIHFYMFSNYNMLFMSLEVIRPKYTVINHQPPFSHFLGPTSCLTNVVKSPDNFGLSGKFFLSHDDRGKILKS